MTYSSPPDLHLEIRMKIEMSERKEGEKLKMN